MTTYKYLSTEFVEDEVYHLFGCPSVGCGLKERSNGAKAYCQFQFWVKVTNENVRAVGSLVARASAGYRRKYNKRPSIERVFSAAKETRLLDTHRYIEPSKVLLHVGLSILTYLATMLMHTRNGRIEDIRKMAIRCD